MDYQLVDLGSEMSDYFQGFGSESYDSAVYGIGCNPDDALDDALEMLAQTDIAGGIDFRALEEEIRADFVDFNNAKLNAEIADSIDSEAYYHIGIRFNAVGVAG